MSRKRIGTETFRGVKATGDEARRVRRELNCRPEYQRGSVYLHQWFPAMSEMDAGASLLVIGMDVEGHVRGTLKRFAERNIAFEGRIVGVDFDQVRITRLKGEFGSDVRFAFILAHPGKNVSALKSLPSDHFDLAVCTYGLHDKDLDPDQILREAARALKDSGTCYVATHSREQFHELLSLYRGACIQEGLPRVSKLPFTHFDRFPMEEAKLRLESYFSQVSLLPVESSLKFGCGEGQAGRDRALADFMRYVDYFPFPGLEELTVEMQGRLRAAIDREASGTLDRQGFLTISKPSGMFECRSPR